MRPCLGRVNFSLLGMKIRLGSNRYEAGWCFEHDLNGAGDGFDVNEMAAKLRWPPASRACPKSDPR